MSFIHLHPTTNGGVYLKKIYQNSTIDLDVTVNVFNSHV